MPEDRYGNRITASHEAAAAYDDGLVRLLRLEGGAVDALARAVALDPTCAVAHADLALLGSELGTAVDVSARLSSARLHAARSTERERSHVAAVTAHLAGDPTPLVAHLAAFPRDALLLCAAIPTIAFAGVTRVPAEAWSIVERAAPAYGDDWWFGGLLAFVRQEQRRFDEAMDLACRSLGREPAAGHSAHARAHAHYETGDHEAGLAWMDAWVCGPGSAVDSVIHFCWHAALHELSLGDLAAVRRRYDAQLRPARAPGCRALVDTGSLLFRWALTPGVAEVPDMSVVTAAVDRGTLERPATPFVALHAAVALLATDDGAGLRALARWAARHDDPTYREVVAPLTAALEAMRVGRCSTAADALGDLSPRLPRLGGSDAQREVVEEARIAALVRAGRLDEARAVLDARLDRRHSPRDRGWRDACLPAAPLSPSS